MVAAFTKDPNSSGRNIAIVMFLAALATLGTVTWLVQHPVATTAFLLTTLMPLDLARNVLRLTLAQAQVSLKQLSKMHTFICREKDRLFLDRGMQPQTGPRPRTWSQGPRPKPQAPRPKPPAMPTPGPRPHRGQRRETNQQPVLAVPVQGEHPVLTAIDDIIQTHRFWKIPLKRER